MADACSESADRAGEGRSSDAGIVRAPLPTRTDVWAERTSSSEEKIPRPATGGANRFTFVRTRGVEVQLLVLDVGDLVLRRSQGREGRD